MPLYKIAEHKTATKEPGLAAMRSRAAASAMSGDYLFNCVGVAVVVVVVVVVG